MTLLPDSWTLGLQPWLVLHPGAPGPATRSGALHKPAGLQDVLDSYGAVLRLMQYLVQIPNTASSSSKASAWGFWYL